ncbi:HlyD family secretion protein [Pedobacter gandavensis]|uniref:HlyD family efflux transporter periplasmic adaptor subunit n=1 Tax=Pedobacter gandavensis TaxID=2679963 RepID=A0ABR6ERQ2_9SPHI|nr:HlyD family secretion protein [Pedobacter gandavensis]MBB2147939.1 HlyD family efflux transporter periplasmic adaptor subunit [Pedobacter gandavensis]
MNTTKAPAVHGPFHTLFTILASLIAAGGLIMGVWFFIFYNNNEETNDAQIDQYVTPVVTRITGYVQDVKYKENQFVHKGDTLIIIDNREYKSHLDLALSEIENAKESVGVLQRNVATTKSNTAVQQSQLDAAKSQVWKAEEEYKRYLALLKEDAATKQQLETMKSNYDSAKAHYEEISHALQSTALSTSEASSRVPVAKTVISGKKAAVDNAALYLSYTILTAPYDGWVGKKTIQPGQLVKEGQTLVSVVSQEKWITANYKETQVGRIVIGQRVTFKADASGDQVFNGVVESFSPASGARFSMLPPDNATGNFVKIEQRIPVRIKLSDPEKETEFLRAGMNVIVVANHQK